MEKQMMAQSLSGFYLYNADMFAGIEYNGDSVTYFPGKANFYMEMEKVETQSKKKSKPILKIYLELENTDEVKKFLENRPYVGCFFKNALNKTQEEVYQIFYLGNIEENEKKITLLAETFRGKYSLGTPVGMAQYETFIEKLKEDVLYIIDKF